MQNIPAITSGRGYRTHIAFRRVEPGDQEALQTAVAADVEALSDDTHFESGVVLAGRDGVAVATYLQWGTGLPESARPPLPAVGPQADTNVYEVAHLWTPTGEPLPLDPGSAGVAVLDVIPFSKPENWDHALGFFIANSRDFQGLDGFLGVAVLTSADRTRITTYAHWATEDAFLAAVAATTGDRVPALREVRSLDELNEVLRPLGAEVGGIPEYHSYDVVAAHVGKAGR